MTDSSSGSPQEVPVWMYWEDRPGQHCPAYLRLCRETVARNLGRCGPLHVLDRATAADWLPDLDRQVWDRLDGPVQRADYVRTRLVHRYGGIWIDHDCIVRRPLDALADHLDRFEFVAWGGDVQGRLFNNLFAARAGSTFVSEWLSAQDRALAATDDWASLPWAGLGNDAIHPLLRRLDYANLPSWEVAPVLWFKWRRFLSPFQDPGRILAADPLTVMLWNKTMGPVLGGLTESELLASSMLVARLLRLALGHSTLEEESRGWTRLHGPSSLRYRRLGTNIDRRLHPSDEWPDEFVDAPASS
jgi:hypothetical protein